MLYFQIFFILQKKNSNKIIRSWKSNLSEGMQSNNVLQNKIKNGWMPPHTSLFIKRNLLQDIGYYNESFKISSDYDFMIRIMKTNNLKIYFLNKFTVKMRLGGLSNKNISNILIKMKEDYIIMKHYNFNTFKTLLLKNLSKLIQFF